MKCKFFFDKKRLNRSGPGKVYRWLKIKTFRRTNAAFIIFESMHILTKNLVNKIYVETWQLQKQQLTACSVMKAYSNLQTMW